jgi:hypothetical protein
VLQQHLVEAALRAPRQLARELVQVGNRRPLILAVRPLSLALALGVAAASARARRAALGRGRRLEQRQPELRKALEELGYPLLPPPPPPPPPPSARVRAARRRGAQRSPPPPPRPACGG